MPGPLRLGPAYEIADGTTLLVNDLLDLARKAGKVEKQKHGNERGWYALSGLNTIVCSRTISERASPSPRTGRARPCLQIGQQIESSVAR